MSTHGGSLQRSAALRAALLIGLVGLLVTYARPAGAPPPLDGPIAFESTERGQRDIWVMQADGSGKTNLTDDKIEDIFPAWSPDGKRIAWTSGGRGPEGEIWIMNADGSGKTQVTFNAFSDYNATWSPDGSEIAFRSFRNGNRDIYVIRSDGTNERRLTIDPASDFGPDWSPDGTRIAWTSIRGGHSAIYSMNPDGGDVRKLTPDALEAALPGWSPAGDRIVFGDGFCDTCGESDLFVMNPDGTGITQVTDTPENELGKSWSYNGKRVVLDLSSLNLRHLSKGDIAAVDMASGAVTDLTNTPGISEEHPDWSPAHARAAEATQATRGSGPGGSPGARASQALEATVSFGPGSRTAVLAYTLPGPGKVRLGVFDVAGREVACLVSGWRSGGAHEVSFAGGERPQVFFYRLEWEGLRATGKFSLGR